MTGKGRQSQQTAPSQHNDKTACQRHLFPWLTAVAAILAIVSYLTPPIRHIVLPPKLEWMQIEQAVRKSYWISVNLVDPAVDSSREIVSVDTPVYLFPVRLTARRGNLDVKSCQFMQGDPSSDYLMGTPTFYRMQGDAMPKEELDEICQALLAHDLDAARGKPHVMADMLDMERHLERYRSLQDRVSAIPVILQQDEPVPFLLVCIPRLHSGGRDYLTGLKDLPARAQVDLYSRQQDALRRLSSKDFTFSFRTNHRQVLTLRGQSQHAQ